MVYCPYPDPPASGSASSPERGGELKIKQLWMSLLARIVIAVAKARFCIECGNRFAAACPSCGTENPPSAKFCAECGLFLRDAFIDQRLLHALLPEIILATTVIAVLVVDLLPVVQCCLVLVHERVHVL